MQLEERALSSRERLSRAPMPKPKRDDLAVKVDRQVVRQARIVAAYRDQDVNEYLSEVLAPLVAQHLAEHQATGVAPPQPRQRKPRPPPSP